MSKVQLRKTTKPLPTPSQLQPTHPVLTPIFFTASTKLSYCLIPRDPLLLCFFGCFLNSSKPEGCNRHKWWVGLVSDFPNSKWNHPGGDCEGVYSCKIYPYRKSNIDIYWHKRPHKLPTTRNSLLSPPKKSNLRFLGDDSFPKWSPETFTAWNCLGFLSFTKTLAGPPTSRDRI